MKELCIRKLEPGYLNPTNTTERNTVALVDLCCRLVEYGGIEKSCFNCSNCQVVTKRKPITEKVPRF